MSSMPIFFRTVLGLNEYFLKQSNGLVWYFTHSARNGLCFCKMRGEDICEYEVLVQNALADYDSIIDDDDNIHLVCQDDGGSIIYLLYTMDRWHKHTILKPKNPSTYDKKFRITKVNSLVNLFYIVQSGGRKMLTHHILQNESALPLPLDYIDEGYSLAEDSHNNLWVFYRQEPSNVFGQRRYLWSQKTWERFEPYECCENIQRPYFFFDRSDNLHIVGVENGDIIYCRNGEKTTIGRGDAPIMFVEHTDLWVLWTNNERVFAAQSADMGTTWQNKEFMAGSRMKPTLFGIDCANASRRADAMQARHCYGYITENTARLYVFSKFFHAEKPATHLMQYIEGEEALEFAREQLAQIPNLVPKESASVDSAEIEMAKLRILVTNLDEKMRKMEGKVERIAKGVDYTNELLKKRAERETQAEQE